MTDSIKESILAKFQQISKEKEVLAPEPTSDRIFNKGKRKYDGRKRQRGPIVSLSESEVGITEYVSPSLGFSGIIKHRFSDFQVHEIDKDGNTVVLNSTELPVIDSEEERLETDNGYRSALTEEQWSELETIMNSDEDKKLTIIATDLGKQERSAIHKAVKRAYGSKVCSNSVKEDDQTYLKIGLATNKDRISWPAHQGRYLHFTVFKENMDTAYLINLMSQNLKMRANLITYAGTKDKRAKTTQRMSVKNKMAEHVKKMKLFKAQFGNYSYRFSPLRLGDLCGNKFTLAIRNVKSDDEKIDEILTTVQSVGFINYFGLQRFGSCVAMPTHVVGKLLILEDWKGAVNAILKPKDGNNTDVQKACEIWAETKNAAIAVKPLGKCVESSIEGRILGALKKRPNSYYDALFAIPRNSLLLYLHAYQSYIWNKVVSKRIREFGLKTIPGDLVLVDSSDKEDDDSKLVIVESSDKKDEHSQGNGQHEEENDLEDDEDTDNPHKAAYIPEYVRKLTEEEAATTPLSKVVYPLPGNDVEFPENAVEQWYKVMMEEDGVTMDNFVNSRKVFSLYGKYRNILTQVQDLEWKIVKYRSPEEDLILSDVDKMRNISLPTIENEEGAEHKAVIMEFTCQSSVYATMLLREVMKCDTSVAFHAKLTQQIHTKDVASELTKEVDTKDVSSELTNEANDSNDEPPEKHKKTSE